MIDINLTALAAIHVFKTEKPIARTLKAEDAYYEANGFDWIAAIAHAFTHALPVPPAPPRVTIVPQSVKLA
jgi:hypothetical protein